MKAALLWLALAPALASGAGQTRDGRVAAWREALELDLAEVVLADEALALVGSEGQLDRDGEALALVARALAQRGREDEARSLLETSRVEPSSRGWVEVERARLALLDDRLETARALLVAEDGSGAARFAALPDNLLLLARVHVRSGQAGRAVPLLKRYLAMAPLTQEAPAAWHMLAQEALARGDAATGRRHLEAARAAGLWQGYYRARRLQVREQPDEPLPRLGLAQLWLQVNEPGRARVVLLEVVERHPGFCAGLEALAEAERKLGGLAAARAALDRALACDPELGRSRYNRALLARELGDPAAARADLELLVAQTVPGAVEPWRLAAHLELARLLLAAGEASAARARHGVYMGLGGTEPLE